MPDAYLVEKMGQKQAAFAVPKARGMTREPALVGSEGTGRGAEVSGRM
jgi:hypothetical protein